MSRYGSMGARYQHIKLNLPSKTELLERNKKAEKIRLIIIAICSFILLLSASYYYSVNTDEEISKRITKEVYLLKINFLKWRSGLAIQLTVSEKKGLKRYVLPETTDIKAQFFQPYLNKYINITVDNKGRLWAVKDGKTDIIPSQLFEHSNVQYQGKNKGAFALIISLVMIFILIWLLPNYFWLRFYTRNAIKNGIVNLSRNRVTFNACKGYQLYWISLIFIMFVGIGYFLTSIVKSAVVSDLNIGIFLVSVFSAIGFGILFIGQLKHFLMKNPWVEITHEYIACKQWEFTSIPWTNIESLSLRVVTGRGSDAEPVQHLMISVKDKKPLIVQMGIFGWIGNYFSKQMVVVINITMLEIGVKDFVSIVKQFTDLEVENADFWFHPAVGEFD